MLDRLVAAHDIAIRYNIDLLCIQFQKDSLKLHLTTHRKVTVLYVVYYLVAVINLQNCIFKSQSSY